MGRPVEPFFCFFLHNSEIVDFLSTTDAEVFKYIGRSCLGALSNFVISEAGLLYSREETKGRLSCLENDDYGICGGNNDGDGTCVDSPIDQNTFTMLSAVDDNLADNYMALRCVVYFNPAALLPPCKERIG